MKTLLIVMHGEPRGFAYTSDYPGTNQFEAINKLLEELGGDFKVHVSWHITDHKVTHKEWDNNFVTDYDGKVYVEPKEWLPRETIVSNIEQYMSKYDWTYSVSIRKPSRLRWNSDFLSAIEEGKDYDYTLIHRPDSNLMEHPHWYDHCRALLENHSHAWMATSAGGVQGQMINFEQVYRLTGVTRKWTTYEIMLWNRKGIDALCDLIAIKAKYEDHYDVPQGFYIAPAHKSIASDHCWYRFHREFSDGAEDFWATIVDALAALTHSFECYKILPFSSVIRSTPEYIQAGLTTGHSQFGIDINQHHDHTHKESEVRLIVDGKEAFLNELDRMNNDREIDFYFVPSVPMKFMYNHFAPMSHAQRTEFYLKRLFNIPYDSDYAPAPGDKITYNVSYWPPEADADAYTHIHFTNEDGSELYDNGFIVQTMNRLWRWVNEFDYKNTHWKQPIGLYVDSAGGWELHPGRQRLSARQLLFTDTPVLLMLDRNNELYKEFDGAVKLTRETFDSVMQEIERIVQPKEKIEFVLRESHVNGHIDAWWYEQHEGRSDFAEVVRDSYWGDTLTIEFTGEHDITFNGERVAFYRAGEFIFYYNSRLRGE